MTSLAVSFLCSAYFTECKAIAFIVNLRTTSVMRRQMPILIDGVVMRGGGVVDAVLLNGDEVRVPVVGDPVTVERRHVVVFGRIRFGIGPVVGIVSLPPHQAIGCPIGERPDLVLGLVVGVGAIH